MKTAVVTFPGANCDDDLYSTWKNFCGYDVDWLWHKDHTDLSKYDLIGVPGGFTFGDYLRFGSIAALSPIMQDVKEYASKGGLVLGICNGFQILCEAGLLPGALAPNSSLKFICKDVYLHCESHDRLWTSKIPDKPISIPIAHGGGRYIASSEEAKRLSSQNQVLFRYCDANGESTGEANPNGSSDNIAGICNEKGNVFGLMPHPERATDLRSEDGKAFWHSIENSIGATR